MYRHELSDQQWARIEPFLPHRTHRGKAGHPFNDHHRIINGILWILHTGAPWRDLPERYGPGRRSTIASTVGGTTGPGSAWSRRCWTNWTISASLTMTCGASTARSSEPAAPPPGALDVPPPADLGRAQGGSAAGAVGPWPGAIAGRLRDEDPPGQRQPRERGGDPHHSGSGPREQGLRADDGPAVVPLPSWPAPMASVAGRRQGLQLPEDPALVPEEKGQACNPDQVESAPGGGLRQSDV